MIRALKVVYVPLIWLCIGLFWLWLIVAAKAQEPVYPVPGKACGPWEEVLVTLYEEAGLLPEVIALNNNGALLIIAVNPKTRDYVVLTQPDERTICLVTVGSMWEKPSQNVIDNIKSKAGDPA